jgi:hypothetical protein
MAWLMPRWDIQLLYNDLEDPNHSLYHRLYPTLMMSGGRASAMRRSRLE